MSHLEKALLLLEDIKLYGTLPFAHLARSAFVAISLLRSAVSTGVLTEEERDDFLNSIHTVSQDFTNDSIACSNNKISWNDFVNKYGHLRPGTYDITSPSYLSDPEVYLRPVLDQASKNINSSKNKKGKLWEQSCNKFFDSLNISGLNGSKEEFERFLKNSIEGREYAKFAFTKNLSAALDEIIAWGENYDLDAETISCLSVEDLKLLSKGTIPQTRIKEWVLSKAKEIKKIKLIEKSIELPPLICSKEDFSDFLYPESQPNFIGNAKVTALCINLEDINAAKESVEGKIVLIPQADPGYDWLFGRNIAGLITMFGGANSHMGIRAAEFGLPAAIGIGETLYRNLSNKSKLELNPGERIIRSLS